MMVAQHLFSVGKITLLIHLKKKMVVNRNHTQKCVQ